MQTRPTCFQDAVVLAQRPVCRVCGSDAVSSVHPGDVDSVEEISFTYTFSPTHCKTLPVFRCQACTHVFCWPIPENISSNYSDVVDEEYLRHKDSRELSARAVLNTIGRYATHGKLLDVGCATGDFLSVARDRGYETAGIELSRWSASIARGRGLTIYDRTLAELARDSPCTWDVITLWGVIEHFPWPAEEMVSLGRLLKPGGLLAIWTGDVNSVTSRLLGRRWWYWQGQHIQYFTHGSLRHLVKSAGFTHVQTELYPFGATRATITNSLRRYAFRGVLEPFVTAAYRLRRIWYLRLPGEMLFLASRNGQA
jgi:SAM-dependent methyltransferase